MIILSAGHNPKAPGAHYENIYEHPVAKQWIHTLVAAFSARSRTVQVVPTGTITEKVRWVNKHAAKDDLALEMHFNSDVSKYQHGSETLYCPGSTRGLKFARAVQNALTPICPPSRGFKEGWYRMDKPGVVDYAGDIEGDEVIDYFLRATTCTALIVEPEFIYNYDAITRAEQTACDAIADAIITTLDAEHVR